MTKQATPHLFYIAEVSPQCYHDPKGPYYNVRVSGVGQGYGYWDQFDINTGKLRIATQQYLHKEAAAEVARIEAGKEVA